MRISGFTTTRPEMHNTRTYEDFSKFLGVRPARIGLVATLYDQYTITHLTESLMNVFTNEKASKNNWQRLNEFMFEWELEVNRIKRVPILSIEGNGGNASDILFRFPENYYQKFDTFVIEELRQYVIVMNRPQRIADNCFLVVGKLVDEDYSAQLPNYFIENCAGKLTRFVTNYMPEMHEEGYTKYTSNTEKFRGYISTHRCDIDYSAMYKPMEDVFIQIGKGKDDDPVYKLPKCQQVLVENFLQVREGKLAWGKSNVDKNGQPTIYDNETGRPIVTSEGVIPQIERFATKFIFSRLTVAWLQKALNALVLKSSKGTGNKYAMICNTLMWHDVQRVIDTFLKDRHTDGDFLWSKASNGYVSAGATYDTYIWAGNTIGFKLDTSLDIEFPDRKYAIMVDISPDPKTGKPAMAQYTFKNGEFIQNKILGVGGESGLDSGVVSSRVAATKLVAFGYAGVAVFNPYKSVVLMSNKQQNPWF